jgi:hypothetical protein
MDDREGRPHHAEGDRYLKDKIDIHIRVRRGPHGAEGGNQYPENDKAACIHPLCCTCYTPTDALVMYARTDLGTAAVHSANAPTESECRAHEASNRQIKLGA